MPCECGEKAVYFRRYSGQSFCSECFTNYFERKVHDTIRKYSMINRGDMIGVGISGGKDSTVLLYVLHRLSSQLEVEVCAILIDEGIEGYRKAGIDAAQISCENLGVPLTVASFMKGVGYTLDTVISKGDLKPCTYCGVFRRKLLNNEAKRLGIDRLAVGHNLDDEAQAVMMNYLSGDIERLHRLTGNAESKALIKRIKPLSRIPEKEVKLYALLNNLEVSTDECPYAKDNYRTSIRDFLNGLETEQPGKKFSIVSGWEKLVESTHVHGSGVRSCTVCSQPSAREVCRACELSEEIEIKMSDGN